MTDYSRGYRAGLEAAAGVAKQSQKDCFCADKPDDVPCAACMEAARIEGAIRGLPVPGEAPAPESDPATARETILRALYAARRPLTRARRLGTLSGGEAARLAEIEKRIDEEEAFEDAAAQPAEAPDLRGLLEDVRVDLEAALAELTNNLDKAGAVADVRHAIARIDVARAAQPERCTASMGFGAPEQRRCMLPTGHAGEHQSATHAWNLAAQPEGQAAPDLRGAWAAMKMVDDAYWGEFCGYCGVVLSLGSQNEECGPQHTAIQQVHGWMEKHGKRRDREVFDEAAPLVRGLLAAAAPGGEDARAKLDIRPDCIICGQPWMPQEGENARTVPCLLCACEMALKHWAETAEAPLLARLAARAGGR